MKIDTDGNLAALREHMAREDALDRVQAYVDGQVDDMMQNENDRLEAVMEVYSDDASIEPLLYHVADMLGPDRTKSQSALSRIDDAVREWMEKQVRKGMDE